jgi:hypothetical protein
MDLLSRFRTPKDKRLAEGGSRNAESGREKILMQKSAKKRKKRQNTGEF